MLLNMEPSAEKVLAFDNKLKQMNQLIGGNKFLTGDQLTIADLSIAAFNHQLPEFYDLTDYPNIKRWLSTVSTELPYFEEINFVIQKERLTKAMLTSEYQQYFRRKLNE